jgi:uncharacterized protein (TIGR03083 family)
MATQREVPLTASQRTATTPRIDGVHMIEWFVAAAGLPRVDRAEAAAVGLAEGRAVFLLLCRLGDEDWPRPTDCTQWDVRTMLSHLVAQCEDSIRMSTMLRRELVARHRYSDEAGVDAHMAVQIDEYRAETGAELVARFATLWPRAVKARRRRPGPLRRIKVNLGLPSLPRVHVSYLLDTIYNRDLWMHRVDLARAVNQPFIVGDHDRHIVAQAVRDLALQWSAAPVALQLTGPSGGSWIIGSGNPTAVVRTDAVAYMRALAGRDTNVALRLISGNQSALAPIRQATIPF